VSEELLCQLAEGECEACRADAPEVSERELPPLLAALPEWQLCVIGEVKQLQRLFVFKNFVEAQAFTNRVAELAEQHNHHPAILLEWGKVTVTWWTHKIHGLHRNDFVMAAKTDRLSL